MEYTQEQLKKIQATVLEMADFFVRFCRENGLLCYFCGGGCIGAVRHKGFIPWDDDLDFFMPRDDYEKLKRIWKDTACYAMQYPTEDYNDHNMYITIRDKRTTLVRPFQAGMDIVHGVPMDIFPLDGFPNGRIARMKQVFWGLTYHLFCTQIIPENHGGMIRLIGKLALATVRNPKRRYKIWRFAEKKMTRYHINECDNVTEICAGPRYFKNKYPKECFEDAIFTDFEDKKMPIPIGYDRYLKIAFGDYRKMPPEEQRVAHHDAVILDTEQPYIKYRETYLGVISK